MLPRISKTSNIPHVSLSVALNNLNQSFPNLPNIEFTTNQFHPSTHPNECLNSQTILYETIENICWNYVCNLNTDTPKEDIVEELGEDIVTYINALKTGELNNQTLNMSVNEKSQFIVDTLNDRLYHLAMSYSI